MKKLLAFIFAVCLVAAGAADGGAYRLKTVFETDGIVWSFAFLSENEILAARRDGKLFYANMENNAQTVRELSAPKVAAFGQGGLLDVQIYKPENADGATYIYATHSVETENDATTALSRALWDGQTAQNWETLFVAKTRGDSGRHFGSRLLFYGGHLYMTIGDRGEREYAQDLSLHNGKILRLNIRGEAAADNPFAGTENALPEIWTYGHRNPQGLDLQKESGRIYAAEFGPRGGDELNLIIRGKNYGWPIITYGREYWGPKIGDTHADGMEQPVAHWTPSVSPSGMAFYDGDKIPEWRGDLFLATLSSEHLRRLTLDENGGKVLSQEVLFSGLRERFRHVRESPDGYLYFSTDSGKIIRVSPK